MKKIMQYSKDKFQSFSDEKKIRIIGSFIDLINEIWYRETGGKSNDSLSCNEERKKLLLELERCLSYLADSSNSELQAVSRQLTGISSFSRNVFQQKVAGFLEKYGKGVKDHDLISLTESGESSHPSARDTTKGSQVVPLSVILLNLRSAFNVGSIIRTSECFGIRKIYMCGYTPTPGNVKVRKTSMATADRVLWEQRRDVIELMCELKERDKVELIAMETVSGAGLLPKTPVKKPACIILGNEAHGLPGEVLQRADKILKIPLFGSKESFNVGVVYGIACYEIMRKWKIIG